MNYNKSDRNFIFSYPMKRLFCAIVFVFSSVFLTNYNAYACGGESCCSSSPPQGCNSTDRFCGAQYLGANFNNDPMNPTADFGITCCSWVQNFTNTYTLSLGELQTNLPGGDNGMGCGINQQSYDAMFFLVNTEEYTNNTITVSIPPVPPAGSYGTINLPYNYTPLSLACNSIKEGTEGYSFYSNLCAPFTNNNSGNQFANVNTSNDPCKIGDSRLICSLPIACAILKHYSLGSKFSHPSNINTYDCQFVLFPPSPPPFCGTIELPVSPPVSVNICQEDTSPSENNICVLPSPDAGYGVTPVVNNFFTPSIRVAFDIQQPVPLPTPPAEFVSVSPWVTTGASATYTGAIPSLGATAPYTSFAGLPKTSVVSNPPGIPRNLELIYSYSSQTPPLYSRYSYQNGLAGSLYGVNIGQYCDLNYNLATNQALASTCNIIDTNGANRTFSASLTCSSTEYNPYECTSICVTDITVTGETVGSCSPVPNMPWPTISACSSGNTPTNFCLNYSFDNGTSTPYTGQIKGVSASPSNNTAPTQGTQSTQNPPPYYTGIISGTSINLQAIVTDDKYNQPDASGNICLNSIGQPAATPCPTYTTGYQPGGLYYLNGQYISGGTQFCYVPISGPSSCVEGCAADNQTSNCNCVEAKVVNVPSSFIPTPPVPTYTSVLISDRVNPAPGDNSANNPYNPEQLLANSLSTPPPPATPNTALRGMTPLEAGLCVQIPQPISSYCPTVSDNWNDCCAHLNSSPFAGGAWSSSLCGANSTNGTNCPSGDSACGDVCKNCYPYQPPPPPSATPRAPPRATSRPTS